MRTSSGIKGQLDEASTITAKKIDLGHEIQENVIRLRSEQRRALVAGFAQDTAVLAAAETRIATLDEVVDDRLDQIETLLVSATGRKTVGEMRRLSDEWLAANSDVIAAIRRGALEQAWSLAREKSNPLIDRIDAHGDELLKQQQAFLDESRVRADASYAQARLLLFAAMLAAAVVAVVVVLAVRTISASLRETARQLREGAEEVASASSQVATAAQSLSEGASEQAAALEETSASMEEVSSMTRSNAERARRAATLITDVHTQLTQANGKLGDMVQTINDISDSSLRVGKIIKASDEIAFQTNILALNAAVEAARAGDVGMGFAVVADEVRGLAQRAAEAARSTAELIEASTQNAAFGVQRVDEVAGAIRQLTGSVVEVRTLSEQVSAASEQQSLGIGQVTTAITEMEKVTQGTAATAEESAAASEELSAQARTSMGIVHTLELMVGGASGSAVVARASRGATPAAQSAANVLPLPAPQPRPGATDGLAPTGTYGQW